MSIKNQESLNIYVYNKSHIKLRHFMSSRVLKFWEFKCKSKNNREVIIADIRDLNDWWKIELLFLNVE